MQRQLHYMGNASERRRDFKLQWRASCNRERKNTDSNWYGIKILPSFSDLDRSRTFYLLSNRNATGRPASRTAYLRVYEHTYVLHIYTTTERVLGPTHPPL